MTAAFSGFAPRRIEKVLPAAWELVPPDEAVDVRARAAGAALRALLPAEDAAGVAADATEAVAARADCAGRVLAAANAALPGREDPFERLWQATTTLREHRGDGHVAALVAADITPVESHLLKIAAGESPEESLRLGRAWDDERWAAGRRRLLARGWTDEAGALTDAAVPPARTWSGGPTGRRPGPGRRSARRPPHAWPTCSGRSRTPWPQAVWFPSPTPWASRAG